MLTGDDRHLADPSRANDLEDIDNTVTLLPIMAAVAGSTAIFVVASTFAFSVIQRRREIALLLVVGATSKQVRRMLIAKAALVGAVASALGCALGVLDANLLAGWLSALGITPPWFSTHSYGIFEWLILAGTFVTGLSVSPVLLTVGIATSLLAATSSINTARDTSARDQVDAQYVLVPDGTPGLSSAVVDKTRAVEGAEVLAPIITIYTQDGDRLDNNDAQVVDPVALANTVKLNVLEGSLSDLRDDTIVVPQVWGFAHGQTMRLTMADGTVARLRIAATYKALRGQDVAYLSPKFANTGK